MKMTNLWRCPNCGKIVDYGASWPSDDGKTWCTKIDKNVQMEKVKESIDNG